MTDSDPNCNCNVPVELANSTLGRHRHICGYFRHPQEEYRVLLPCMKEGLARSDRTVQIVEPALRDEYRQQLRAAGIDVDEEERRGRLEVLSGRELYLEEGRFGTERMLAILERSKKVPTVTVNCS